MLLIYEDGNLNICYLSKMPGGSVVKNVPVNAGDTGLIPDTGVSQRPWSNQAHGLQLLSLCSTAREQQLLTSPLLEPGHHHKRSRCN